VLATVGREGPGALTAPGPFFVAIADLIRKLGVLLATFAIFAWLSLE
jgi:hypothetical protein